MKISIKKIRDKKTFIKNFMGAIYWEAFFLGGIFPSIFPFYNVP